MHASARSNNFVADNTSSNEWVSSSSAFYRVNKAYELVFSTPVLLEGSMFFGDKVIGIRVLHEPLLLTMRTRVLARRLSKQGFEKQNCCKTYLFSFLRSR